METKDIEYIIKRAGKSKTSWMAYSPKADTKPVFARTPEEALRLAIIRAQA